jgi:hypothetical protein
MKIWSIFLKLIHSDGHNEANRRIYATFVLLETSKNYLVEHSEWQNSPNGIPMIQSRPKNGKHQKVKQFTERTLCLDSFCLQLFK